MAQMASEASVGNLGEIAERGEVPDRVAVIDLLNPDAPRRCTYRELNGLIDGVALFLQAQGLQRGARVAILSLNRIEYIAAYLGIMKAGLVAVPVNIKLPPATVAHMMTDSDVAFAFTDGPRAMTDPALPSLNFDDPGPEGFTARVRPGRFDAVAVAPDDTAQILYTSGSTGIPKGVPLTHSGMLWALEGAVRPGLEDERQIVAQPLFHMNGLMVVKSALRNGSSLVVMPSFVTAPYTEALAHLDVTRVFAVPTMMARVLKELDGRDDLDFSNINHITLSSAPTTAALIAKVSEAFPAAVVDVSFGCTEGGPRIFGPHPDGRPKPVLAFGTEVGGCEIRLDEGSPDEGVLYVRNPAVMSGYLNLPGKTAEVLHERWYRTGDVVRRDPDGFYYFVGRADDMFVCSGENIYPGDVEKMLEMHPSVQQAAVVPLPDDERGQIPTAFIVTRRGEHLSAADIKSFALASGPAYQHPRRIALVADLPWAGTNKIDRQALATEAAARERDGLWSR